MNIFGLSTITVIIITPAIAVAQPGTILQGGDNIGNAYQISSLPFADSGTTTGYFDDYSGSCGVNNGAPDIVYAYTVNYVEYLTISLCRGSNFDTRLYVFQDNPSNEIACSDDDCVNQYSDFVSKIECLELGAGHTYYIVIDGYSGASGNYTIDIMPPVPGIPFIGTVTESGNGPIRGATIKVLQGESPVWEDTTDSAGYYEVVFLPDGQYFVEASRAGYQTQASGPYEVDACRANVVNFELLPTGPPPIGSIVGIVTDSLSGVPLQGAFVQAFESAYLRGSDTTDVSGYYSIIELQVVPHDIEASLDGYVTKIVPGIEVIADDSVRVDIPLAGVSSPCDLTPPTGAIIEDEPTCYEDYEDIYNAGCSAEIWDTIPANCSVFGSTGDFLYQGLQYRDTDWFEFQLDDSAFVSLTGVAEFDMTMMIIRQGETEPCSGYELLYWRFVPLCDTVSLECDLAAGLYWVWIAPQSFEGVECGSNYLFLLHTIPYGGCDYIPGDIGGNGQVNGIDVVYGVNFFKGGTPPIVDCGMPIGPCPIQSPFYPAGDVNGNCVFNGIDITYFVNYLKGNVIELLRCQDCPPAP